MEGAGGGYCWELREDGLGGSGCPPLLEQRAEMVEFLVVCTYIFMIQFVTA